MAHTIIIIIWTIFATIFLGLLVIVTSIFTKTGDFQHRVARIWAKSILMVSGINVQVIGKSNIIPSQSCIYMSNHQSNFDIPVLLAYLPVQFRWLAKAELFKIPIFGFAMHRVGYISIDRDNRKSAMESLSKAAEAIRNGKSVMIFPEGTRSETANILPFKKGGFVLAVDAGVPLIPIIIHGTGAIMPRKQIKIRPGKVILEIKPPIQTSEYSRKTKDDLIQTVRQIIIDSFEKNPLLTKTVENR